MKKYIFMIMCSLVAFSTQGQQLGEVTWKKVSHEVRQLVITNENIQSELDSMLFRTKQNTLLSVFKKYEYLHLYVRENSDCQTLEFRLSNYPYKSENLIVFFVLNGYLVFVHQKLPDFLMSTGDNKKFTYTECKLGNLTMTEDDTPCWIMEYRKKQLKMLHYPTKR